MALAVRALILASQPITTSVRGVEQPCQDQERPLPSALSGSHWEIMGLGPSASSGHVLPLKQILRCIPDSPFLFILHSGSVVLLLLQTDSCEAGRSSLLPGLFMAAQGVHASSKVTVFCHINEHLSFLTEVTLGTLQRGNLPVC